MKILIATEKPFAANAVDCIRQEIENAGHELLLLENYTEKEQLNQAIKDVDAVIVRSDKITPEVLDHADNLKIIVRAGAGYDSIDCGYAKLKNIVVENTPGQNANAVAELVFGLLVYAARNFYNGKLGAELLGKKIGILAFGNVGQNVARIAKGFGMEIYAFDPYCPPSIMEKAGVRTVNSKEELFKLCNVVSLHIPATSETKQSINYSLINSLPKGAIIVNTARKEIIYEEELLKVLEERKDIKYLTDIMPDRKEEFEKFATQYFSTPKKMGAQTAEANFNAGLAAAKQINAFFANGDTTYQVNK